MPGVHYLEIVVPWPRSRDCSRLRKGELIAVSGLLERNAVRNVAGHRNWDQRIVADWIERL